MPIIITQDFPKGVVVMDILHINTNIKDFKKLYAIHCSQSNIYEMLLNDLKSVLLDSSTNYIYCSVVCSTSFPFNEVSKNIGIVNKYLNNILDIKFIPSLEIQDDSCYYTIVNVYF
jgi:hypothetical protein